MTRPEADSPRWSPARWWIVSGSILALEVTLILLLSDRVRPLPREARSRSRVFLMTAPATSQRLAALALPADPTLFALASQREFTGEAWKRPGLAAPRLPEWTESSRLVRTQSPAGLGTVAAAFLNTLSPPSLTAAGRPPGAIDNLVSSPPGLRTRSVLRVEGPLATRPLAIPLTIPPWPHPDLLTNTVVEVAVNADGFAVSAATRQGSGSAAADRKAFELARGVRFEAASSPGKVDHGNLVFEWLTVPPTNPPPAAPP